MGRMSRTKGKVGERELSALLREHGFEDARRTAQYCGKTGDASDVVGLPNIHIECKRVEKLNIYDAVEQAQRDSIAKIETGMDDVLPIVAHRKNRKPWLVTMLLDDWMRLYKSSEYKEEEE